MGREEEGGCGVSGAGGCDGGGGGGGGSWEAARAGVTAAALVCVSVGYWVGRTRGRTFVGSYKRRREDGRKTKDGFRGLCSGDGGGGGGDGGGGDGGGDTISLVN